MSDVGLQTLLDRARQLQAEHYEIDNKLETQLAQGLIKNAASLLGQSWNIGFMDMNGEKPEKIRGRILDAVDCLLYALSILSIQEIDTHTLLHIISDRQKMILDMHKTAETYKELPVDKHLVVLDIDGVIFPYPDMWLAFQESLKDSDLSRSQIKEQYRLSGIKASTPPIKGARELIDYFKSQDCIVILLSSRPVNLYPEVYRFTVKFLDRYGLKPDLLFFKDHKALAAELQNLWHRVIFFVDDEHDYLSSVKKEHSDVCCVHITKESPDNLADYHFENTYQFYQELKENVDLQSKFDRKS